MLSLLWLPVLAGACRGASDGPGPPPPDGAASAGGGVAAAQDSVQLVTVTFRRDSLGLSEGAPPDSTRIRIEQALARLGGAADFEVMAISPAILAVQLRPRSGRADSLAASLGAHPLVQAAEVERLVRP